MSRRLSTDPQLAEQTERRSRPARRERVRNRKKLDPMVVGRTLLVLALVGQGVRAALTSPRMRLQNVRVTGSQRYTPADVARIAEIPLNQNIFRVNLVRVSNKLRAEPVVRDVVVSRDFPQGLHVQLFEREPAFRVTAGNDAFDADRDGIVFQKAEGPAVDRPVLEVPRKDLPALGGRVRAELLQAVWECDRLARAEALSVRKMRVDGVGELWLNVATSSASQPSERALQVRVGRSTELPAKFRDIREALQVKPQLITTAEYLNVMSAGHPSYKVATDEGQ